MAKGGGWNEWQEIVAKLNATTLANKTTIISSLEPLSGLLAQ